MGTKYDIYYHTAVGSCVVSALTIVSLLIVAPMLCNRTATDRDLMALRSERFRDQINGIWAKIRPEVDGAVFFSRVKKSPWDKRVCSGCNQLSCPMGMPGMPGQPGEDGSPGNAGMPGSPGDDGFDVELEPEDDMPCVICPAGPPGMRGLQGERGQPGQPGPNGEQGPDGNPGIEGPKGHSGKQGPMGNNGRPGVVGPDGETTIAGVGIKGPHGPPGPPGPKGPNGSPGRASRDSGVPGKVGESGVMGPPGIPGKPGEDGSYGPPGEPGEPAAYCHSDCGVSEILAPSLNSMMSDMSENGYSNDHSSNQNYAPASHSVMNDGYGGYYHG